MPCSIRVLKHYCNLQSTQNVCGRIYKLLYEIYDNDNLVLATYQSKMVSIVKVTNIRRHSRKTNKLRNTHTICREVRKI